MFEGLNNGRRVEVLGVVKKKVVGDRYQWRWRVIFRVWRVLGPPGRPCVSLTSLGPVVSLDDASNPQPSIASVHIDPSIANKGSGCLNTI